MNTATHKPEAPPASQLAGLLTINDVPEHYPRIFQGVESVRWYLRNHRGGLEEAGALLIIRGKIHLVPDRFEPYVLSAGKEAAKRQGRA